MPDLDVTYISQRPLYHGYWMDYPDDVPTFWVPDPDAPDGKRTVTKEEWQKLVKYQPAEGDKVTFTAHVRNNGFAPAPATRYVIRLDDKVVASWNGLAISGLAKGYQITGDERYREAALRTAVFIRDSLLVDGRLIHSYREGKISEGLFLEDYAYFIHGLIDLYEIVHDYEWIRLASRLASDASAMFSDESGNLYLAPANQMDHFMRPLEISDGALPAPGSILMQSLLKLADITGKKEFRRDAEKYMAAISPNIAGMPQGMISAVVALDYLLSDRVELVLVGENDRNGFLREIYDRYLPHRVVVVSEKGVEPIALLEGREPNGSTLAYVCRNSTCGVPASTPEQLKMQLAQLQAE